QRITAGLTFDQNAVGVDHTPSHIIRHTDHSGFRYYGVADKAGFNFCRAEAIAADLDHIIDAANDPDVAVIIAAGRVPGQIPALIGIGAPVLAEIAVRIAVNGAEHPRPRAL